jgi:hypothetical protein
MIYTLEYDYSQGLYEADWIDVLKRTGLEYKTLFHDCSTGDDVVKPTNYIFQNVKDINNSVGNDDYLLIDSAYIFQHEETAPNYYEVCKFVHENIDCKKIIVFHPDTGIGRHNNNMVYGKVESISPMYYLDETAEESKNRFNMYINNTGKNKHRYLSRLVAERWKGMMKYKTFQFTNGVMKEHRTLLYAYLKKDNLLDKCFYSYIGYDSLWGQRDKDTYKEHFETLKPKRLTEEEYNEICNDLPIYLDYQWNGRVDQDSLTLPYSCNSYFQIVGCTNINDNTSEKSIYTSEKIFKPYLSFQIPLFFGPMGLHSVLKKLGFNLFENIIDYEFDTILNPTERFHKQYENVHKIGQMDRYQLRDYYEENFDKLIENYELLETLSNNYVNVLKSKLSC